MRVAVLSWYAPGGQDSGERVRLAGVIAELATANDVDCLFLEPSSDGSDDSPRDWLDIRTRLNSPHYGIPKISIARASLRGRSIYADLLNHRDITRPVQDWLRHQSYDVILANQLYVLPMIPRQLHSRVILDSHNADSMRLKRLAQHTNPVTMQRMVASLQSRLTRRLEVRLARTLLGVWAVSDLDASHYASLGYRNVAVVPNGAQVLAEERREARATGTTIELLFVGSLGYSANLDALQLFCNEWAPGARDFPWRLTVVGSGDSSRARHIVAAEPRITVLGRVDSVNRHHLASDALVVPMRQGGGSRLKVIEALAVGLPIISTEMGMEGFDAQPGKHYLKVHTAEDFQSALGILQNSPVDVQKMSRDGLRLGARYAWPAIGNTMQEALTKWGAIDG